jgi:SulP family sulfate permease
METEASPNQGRLIITSNGVQVDERTPLIAKAPIEHHHHPDWIRGEQDLERQETKRKESWPRLRNVVFWPTKKGFDIARTIVNPKRWDKQAIKNAAIAPVGYLPAVILGLLLNILDALSYGTFQSEG